MPSGTDTHISEIPMVKWPVLRRKGDWWWCVCVCVHNVGGNAILKRKTCMGQRTARFEKKGEGCVHNVTLTPGGLTQGGLTQGGQQRWTTNASRSIALI